MKSIRSNPLLIGALSPTLGSATILDSTGYGMEMTHPPEIRAGRPNLCPLSVTFAPFSPFKHHTACPAVQMPHSPTFHSIPDLRRVPGAYAILAGQTSEVPIPVLLRPTKGSRRTSV